MRPRLLLDTNVAVSAFAGLTPKKSASRALLRLASDGNPPPVRLVLSRLLIDEYLDVARRAHIPRGTFEALKLALPRLKRFAVMVQRRGEPHLELPDPRDAHVPMRPGSARRTSS